jgi:hypothetical protein
MRGGDEANPFMLGFIKTKASEPVAVKKRLKAAASI